MTADMLEIVKAEVDITITPPMAEIFNAVFEKYNGSYQEFISWIFTSGMFSAALSYMTYHQGNDEIVAMRLLQSIKPECIKVEARSVT